MKIRITIEKDYDSDEFYSGSDPEELEELTVQQFKDGIIEDLYDYPTYLIDLVKFEIVE